LTVSYTNHACKGKHRHRRTLLLSNNYANPKFTRLPTDPTTIDTLMRRPCPDVLNYQSQMLPFLRQWQGYKDGFIEMLRNIPANFYAVANFNMPCVEPDWCRGRLNLFDMKLSRLFYGKNWSQIPPSERFMWVAVPERATYLHYNLLFDVPAQLHELFWYEAPRIWRQVVPPGDLYMDVIGDTALDLRGVTAYPAKAFHPVWTIDNMVTSEELRRGHK